MNFYLKRSNFYKNDIFPSPKIWASEVTFISPRTDVKMVKMMETSNFFDAKLIFTLKEATFTKMIFSITKNMGLKSHFHFTSYRRENGENDGNFKFF